MRASLYSPFFGCKHHTVGRSDSINPRTNSPSKLLGKPWPVRIEAPNALYFYPLGTPILSYSAVRRRR